MSDLPPLPATPDALQAPPATVEFSRPSPLRNAAHLLSSQLVTWVLATVVTVVQPRFLGPVAQGQLRLSLSLWGIGAVAIALGMNNLLALDIARTHTGKDIVATSLTLRLVNFGVVAALMVAYAVVRGVDGTMVQVLALGGVACVLMSMNTLARATLMGFEHMGYIGIADVAAKTVSVVAVIAVLLAGYGVVAVASTGVLMAVVSNAVIWRYARRMPGVSIRPRLRGAATMARRSLGLLAAEGALILYQQVDVLVLSALVDKRQLGWYGASDLVFTSLLFVPSIVLSSLLPVIGRLHVDDPARLRSLVDRAFVSLLAIGVPIGFGTIVVAQPAAVLLWGQDFAPTGQLLSVMGLVLILVYITVLMGFVAIGTGQQRLWTVVMVIGTAASVPLDLAFVPIMERRYGNGAIGGGLSFLVTESFMVVVGLWKVTPYVLHRRSIVRIGKVVVAGLAMVAVSWPLRERFIALPVVVAIAVYVGAVLVLRIPTVDEVAALRDVAGKVRRRLPGASS